MKKNSKALGADYDAAVRQVEAAPFLRAAGEEGMGEWLDRKSSGRKLTTPRGETEKSREASANDRAAYMTRKRAQEGNAISEIIEATDLPVGQAVRMVNPKRGSRADRAP